MESNILSKNNVSSNAYAPGLSPKDLFLRVPDKEVINLASNESPYQLNDSVLNHINKNLLSLTRYPDDECLVLKKALSDHVHVSVDSLYLGNGSSEVLFSIGKVFLGAESDALYSEYSFVVYKMIAEAMKSKSVVVPSKNWGHDLDAMLDAITSSTKIIFIANPNNPTGTWLAADELADFIDKVPGNIIIVVDEAYFEFTDHLNLLDTTKLINKYKNLIVTRTFSKAYGLAGIRLGYAVAATETISLLNRAKLPYSINTLALAAGEAAIKDKHYLSDNISSSIIQKNKLYNAFDGLGVNYIESAANFVTFDAGITCDYLYESLAKHGVLVRPLSNYAMPHHLRVTIGSSFEIDEFIRVMKLVWVSLMSR